ncbi:MAG TPA: alpha/beta hydrolase [Dyella sp.]|uniref:serine aminopeptidase domain-containing protein n=1 Tax=Dyella sp. TaxID=1869338 RepID=UPI002F93504C
MELPFHFGPGGELFGLFHATGMPPRKAVLLCPPLGQDQIRCHRLYRQLAHALAAEGVAALRFDYYGSGDSAGASEELNWRRCIADTALAADELRRRSGCERVIAFGARLGACIAVETAASARLAGLMIWDPIVDGAGHVARLDAMQEALRHDPHRFTRPRSCSDIAAQWLGFAVSERLRSEIGGLHLVPVSLPTLVLDSQGAPRTPAWRDAPDTSFVSLDPSVPWDDLDRLEAAILSHPLVQAVTAHVRSAA